MQSVHVLRMRPLDINNNNNEIINQSLNKSNHNNYEHLSLENHMFKSVSVHDQLSFTAHLGSRELTGIFLAKEFPMQRFFLM